MSQIRVPVLIVCGANSASCGRAAALQAAECGAGAAGARRVVVVGGAGGALRPGPAHAHVPPHALDAAVLVSTHYTVLYMLLHASYLFSYDR